MSIERLNERFASNRAQRRGSLLPYLTAGYPDSKTVAELIRRADGLGAAAVEIGFPYSDSIADGPVIQSSFHSVLARGHTLDDTFKLCKDLRADVGCALIAMVSVSIVWRVGTDRFIQRCVDAGFDGLIVPDLPVEEANSVCEAASRAGLFHVGLVAPTTPVARRAIIAQASTGFIYQIAVSGTTGERNRIQATLATDLECLRGMTKLPICVGFGVSTPQQVREVCAACDGAIVGSALLRRIDEALNAGANPAALVDSVGGFLSELISATVLDRH